jgi:serine phosphatase RsbU (regulator of sigma subunit)
MPSADPTDRLGGTLLRIARTMSPEHLVDAVAAAAEPIGGRDVVLLLVDYEQAVLTPHPAVVASGERQEPATVEGSMAGRAFQSNAPASTRRDDGWRVWVPVTERADRLGVLSLTVPRLTPAVERYCTELGETAAHLVLAARRYTDLPYRLRRRKDVDLAAEMQWSLLPPLSFTVAATTLSGLLEPAYEVGGDCFDYAVNEGVLHLAIFDCVGHGLTSAVLASLVVGAYRNGRREAHDLAQLADGIDGAVRAYADSDAGPAGGPPVFATALLARLDPGTGRLTWSSSGHPAPIVVRGGATLPEPVAAPGAPLGMGGLAPVTGDVTEVLLQPGDGVLLYTDGVTEARSPSGDTFGEDALRDLLAREHRAGGPPQETVRRLVRTARDHQQGALRDDASLVYLRWDKPGTTDGTP